MLKNFISSYFIKLLFEYIDEKQKLKLIKYNKSLQKNININIINYQFFSEKYIIYESKGIGKEYNVYYDILIFEGEYLNGERNGKGKEYWGDFLEFEGEYFKGKRHGKGKQYSAENSLEFEGNYLNGQKKWKRNKILS